MAVLLLAGCAVALGLGVYGREHTPVAEPLFLAGFSGALQLKTWLATAALLFVVVQLLTALWMYGRLGTAPSWAGPAHRWSGAIAFTLLVPVAVNCLYSLGFDTYDMRTTVHSLAGCVFYGAYTSKMLALRVRGVPGAVLPLLGGLLFTAFLVLWFTSAYWFFGSGRPLT